VTHYVGIDFGTTNSAIAVADQERARLAPLASGTTSEPTWRTVLYFEPEASGVRVTAGRPAIERYLANEGEGRLIQSFKSHLASRLFSRTQIFTRALTLEELVAAFLTRARDAVGFDLGRRVVIGRPVRYWGASNEDDDERAVARMRSAAGLAGFDEVVFELEPVAAALHYASRLDHDELVLIADFGGGTSDFSLVEVGPRGHDDSVIATSGIAIGGDALDGRIIDDVVSPSLGKGTTYTPELGGEMPVPPWLFTKLRRWHHLSFLKEPTTVRLLERIEAGSSDPDAIARLRTLIDEDLGLPLHRAVEATKIELSNREAAPFRFSAEEIALSSEIARDSFERWIAPEIEAIDRVVAGLLDGAGVAPSDVDRVFATGGSSFVPAIRNALTARFGEHKVVGGEELTSVATGLAERARRLWS
jgi:hypothetical chaperone protein